MVLGSVYVLQILQPPAVAPAVAMPCVSTDSGLPSAAPRSFPTVVCFLSAPSNPSKATFAGWLQSNGEPLCGSAQAVSLEKLSSDHTIPLDDHSYAADKAASDQKMSVASHSK